MYSFEGGHKGYEPFLHVGLPNTCTGRAGPIGTHIPHIFRFLIGTYIPHVFRFQISRRKLKYQVSKYRYSFPRFSSSFQACLRATGVEAHAAHCCTTANTMTILYTRYTMLRRSSINNAIHAPSTSYRYYVVLKKGQAILLHTKARSTFCPESGIRSIDCCCCCCSGCSPGERPGCKFLGAIRARGRV